MDIVRALKEGAMASRRTFIKGSLTAIGAWAARLALPLAALGTRCLPPLLRYARPPYWRFNLLTRFQR